MRAVHAKGILCRGSFVPSTSAAEISEASHFSLSATPVLARFSNFSGVPDTADNDPLASPRGMAIKFMLPGGADTDIVAHSYDGFPAATPDEFVQFLTALGSKNAADLTGYLAAHDAARTFIEAPKLAPSSYGSEAYFGVNAFKFTNKAGEVRMGRYRIVPLAGLSHLSEEQAEGKAGDYLGQDLAARLATGPIRFRIDLQLADDGDQTTNGSVRWPADRRVVPLGTLTLDQLVPDGDALQRTILFTPLNLVEGILPSGDPMLTARSRAYRISHERRSAQAQLATQGIAPAATP